MIYKNGLVFCGGRLERLDLEVNDGILTRIAPHIEGEGEDCSGKYILPLMADIHTHGCLGIDFCEADKADMAAMDEYYLSTGVGYHLPTIISSPKKEYKDIVSRLNGRKLRLEGPFFAPVKKGAHDEKCLCLPDMELIDSLGGSVAMVDIDPTLPGALDMIERLEKRGIKTSLAHTGATYTQAMEAFDRGCRHVTHLFNAMNGIHHRESGLIGAAFDRKDVVVELICDGYHIDPSVLRMAFRLFEGRVAVISDSYKTMGIEHSGCAKLPDGTIAGAVQGVGQTCMNLIKWGTDSLEAIKAACITPFKAMGIEPFEIKEGEKAAFVIPGGCGALKTVIGNNIYK